MQNLPACLASAMAAIQLSSIVPGVTRSQPVLVRAVIDGEAQGLIKVICDKKKKILGAHILGPSAGELIHEYVLAMQNNIPITGVARTIHVYPPLSMGVKRSADEYYRERLFSGWLPKAAKRIIRRGK